MDTSPIIPVILHPEPLSTFYDLGQHVVEVTHEGGILLAEHAPGNAPFKEAVSLDQNETYHLFLALQEWFTSDNQQGTPPGKGHDRCS